MTPDLEAWVAARRRAVLVTLRHDGRPQTSNVLYAYADGVARVSVTADRAKTRNLERDPRAVLHVLGDDFWEYASVSVEATVGAVSTTAGDAAGQELLELYALVSDKPHPEPDTFLQSMVSEQRLVLSLRVTDVVGLVPQAG